jgi:hypothetical protein
MGYIGTWKQIITLPASLTEFRPMLPHCRYGKMLTSIASESGMSKPLGT